MKYLNRLSLYFYRFFFYLLYNPFAWSYDWVAKVVSVGLWEKWVLCITTDIDNSPILELGHGPGHFQKAMAQRGFSIYGLDSSKNMGRLAYSRLINSGCKIMLVNGYAQFLPFADDYFRFVVATFPSEYILDNSTLSEIYRVLSRHGSFIWIPAAWITGQTLFHNVAAKLFQITHQVPSINPQPINHINQILNNYGFSVKNELRKIDNSTILITTSVKS